MAAGLTPRPIMETIADTWEWIKDEQPPLAEGWGTTSVREQQLLEDWEQSQAAAESAFSRSPCEWAPIAVRSADCDSSYKSSRNR